MSNQYVVPALVLVLAGLLGVALMTPEPPGGHGTLHPEYTSMLSGGQGHERHGPILPLAWAIGTVQILLFVALMLMGLRRRDGLPKGLAKPFLLSTLAYLAAWTAVILAYGAYMRQTSHGLWLALPAPTALMLYVLWPVPIAFALIYVFGFRRFVLSEEDQEAFQELVARRRARLGQHDGVDG